MRELRQKYSDRPDLIAIIDEAIAVSDGEYTDVMVKAHHADPVFANELNAIVLDLIYEGCSQ